MPALSDREVDRRGLEDDVLRTQVERGVRRRELVGEHREGPVPVGAPAGAEHLPQRREARRVLDLHDRFVVEPLESGGNVTDRRTLRLDEGDDAVVIVGVDDLGAAVVHALSSPQGLRRARPGSGSRHGRRREPGASG